MNTFQFKFKTSRSVSDVQTGSVNADNLQAALTRVREEYGAGIVILGYNTFPNYWRRYKGQRHDTIRPTALLGNIPHVLGKVSLPDKPPLPLKERGYLSEIRQIFRKSLNYSI